MRILWQTMCLGFVLLCGWALGGHAASLFAGGGTAQPLIRASLPGAGAAGGSLFADRQEQGLFAPWPAHVPRVTEEALARLMGPPADDAAALRDLIARAEAGPAGYNAVVWSAAIKPPRPPSDMTLGEIDHWIRATPGQNHAIGRYQFIPATLRRLVAQLGLGPQTRFGPQVQDRLADLLLEEAGIDDLRAGRIGRRAFMQNLARIWAGLPMPSGRSYYQGVAGNKATMSWARFEAEMARIFPG